MIVTNKAEIKLLILLNDINYRISLVEDYLCMNYVCIRTFCT